MAGPLWFPAAHFEYSGPRTTKAGVACPPGVPELKYFFSLPFFFFLAFIEMTNGHVVLNSRTGHMNSVTSVTVLYTWNDLTTSNKVSLSFFFFK